MSKEFFQPKRVFAIEEANATLPLVGAITADLVALSNEVVERKQRLDSLTAGRELEPGDPYSDELAVVADELQRDGLRVRDYIDELKVLGVEVESPTDGIIDFPTILDGEIMLLCWQLGESEVMHVHAVDGGFANRQPLFVESIADGGGAINVEDVFLD